ncbi:MAG TPA: isoprenylcysteine carboxylmethyltransferase family protein [Plantibacter sp.]|uniref:methyltransferase family protein n=1 Tax=unclassified Plantibacter TaxID=2624265 RepID=UPI002BE9DD9A|nr:isoprenylcysteine carboxylmethyltransferase family protein [Plantibacter sp.]
MVWGRWYFAVQSLAGAAWWVSVFLIPPVRQATLGTIDPTIAALLDVPLFVVASAIAAFGLRCAAFLATGWTILVTIALGAFAAVTGQAGAGAVLMIVAAVGSVVALALVSTGGIPRGWVAVGPFAFRSADAGASVAAQLGRTGAEIVVFWGVFLGVIPAILVFLERRWQVAIDVPAAWSPPLVGVGVGILLLGSALGLWSAATMATRGNGTPLPSAMPNRLVVAGPYRFVRNPMALGSIAQGVGLGLALSSWMVVVYALCGAVLWNVVVRPVEERDLETRFGQSYGRYRDELRCWLPTLRPLPATR